ncbi:MAG: hypothetical protein JO061_21845, partial [Acidobacteriaceae bacterium]|nr:hypothetical protein [Acidobacteriaceae bacterium]
MLAFCALAASARAATSTTWEVNGFTDLLKGRISGLSLGVTGNLQLGPSLQASATLNQPALWSVAPAPGGGVYAATGNAGKLFRVDEDGKVSAVWSAPEAELFAVCVDSKGRIYAGSSPGGALYRIDNGKGTEIWHSPAKYIWTLAPASDGSVFVATGEPGKVFRVQPDGKAELFYDTGQMNVTSMAVASNGHVYVGTDPNGLLYDIAGPGKATILYDSTLPEIRAIALAADGTVYAAAMGGAVSTRTGATPSATTVTPTAVTTTAPTVITVTEAATSGDQPSAAPPGSQPATGTSTSSAATTGATTSAVTEVAGVEKSAIYRISPEHVVETLRSSKEDNVYDLLLDGDAVIFSTDVRGRIFRLANHSTTLMAELADGETTRLLKVGDMLYAAMSNPGRLFALGAAGSKPGYYESQVHDSTSVARWGHLRWHGSGTGVVFRTRT